MRCKNLIGSMFSILKSLPRKTKHSSPWLCLTSPTEILCFNKNLIYLVFPVVLFFQLCIFALFSGKGGW